MRSIPGSVLRTALDDLRGQVVIVTGGGRGLGLAIARGFALEGARVAIIGRNAETLRAAADRMISEGGEVRAFTADVSSESSIANMCDEVLNAFGRIDVLVNNAGINPYFRRTEETTLAQWSEIIDTNLTGAFLCCSYVGRHMLQAQRGSIINVTSIAARVGLPRTAAYCAAKGGLELLTRQLAVEWADRSVRVNAVGPGYMATDLTQGIQENPSLQKSIMGRTPLRRLGESEEVVGACLFLGSSAASYITGHSLMVDGGWTAC